MWLARLVWLLLLLATVTSQDPPPCDAIIGTLEIVNDKVCTKTSSATLGHLTEKAIVDYSKANPDNLLDFYKDFTKVRAGIVMDGNEKMETLDVLEEVDATGLNENDALLLVRHNLLMYWITNSTFVTNKPVKVLIYNNPRLQQAAIIRLNQMLSKNPHITRYIQEKEGDCQFANPMDPSDYKMPTDRFLHQCKSVKGNFIMNGGAPIGAIELTGGGCLSLTDVDLTKYEITFSDNNKGTGVLDCQYDTFKSSLISNRGLCEQKILELLLYFPKDMSKDMRIEPHASCAIDCTKQEDIDHRYRPCRTANGIINQWFTKKLAYKTEILESSSEQLNITKSDEVVNATLVELTRVKDFHIAKNPHLIHLNLPKLSTAETLRIARNRALTTLDLSLLEGVKTLEIRGNGHLATLNLPQLKSVEKLIISENAALSTINFLLLTTVQNLIITENDQLHMLASTILAQELKPPLYQIDCNTGDMAFTTTSQLAYCTTIKGMLILERLEDLPADALKHIQLIDGCIIIRNTNLTNIDFLKEIKTKCQGEHLLEDNPHLCPVRLLNSVEVRVEGEYKKRCDGTCYDKLAPRCTQAIGDIVITSETPTRHYEILESINGSLSIVGTDIRTLILPHLDEIVGFKGPLLRIVNNDELSMVKMPALETVKLVGKGRGPLVEIHSNLMLNVPPNALHFLPDEIYDACFDGQEEICIYDGKRQHYEWTFTKAAIMMVCLSLYLALFCGCLYLCCRQERREIQQMRERSHVVAERMATPKRGGSMSPIPKSPIPNNSPIPSGDMSSVVNRPKADDQRKTQK